MSNIAITIGRINVYWYSILILTGAIIAYIIASINAKKVGIKKKDLDDFAFGLIPIAIIGARIYYCIFQFSQYKDNLLDIFKVWEGGLAIHGGLIAGIIWIFIFTKKRNIRPFDLMDIIAPGLILAQAIGRWGNFFNQEAHGGTVSRAFLEYLHIPEFIIKGMNINGVYYHPTFLYESLWCLIGFIILILVFRLTKKTGLTISIYLVYYSIGRFLIESLRTDSLMLGPLRMAQVISIIAIITGIVGIIVSIEKRSD